MKAYINGIGLISPQKSFGGEGFLTDVVGYNSDFLKCIDPNYRDFIDPMAARRMSRLIKMGIASARICLADAGFYTEDGTNFRNPDAIITGTGLGSVEDTEKILNSMIRGEQILNPTPFIQSTYNTISSQIAISLKCHSYNSTYVHRSFSFESCLLDALLQIGEETAKNVLVGGIDEMTENHLNIIRRLGQFKMEPSPSLEILNYHSDGAIAGEGSGYFLLSSESSEKRYATLAGTGTFYRPGTPAKVGDHILAFLAQHNLNPSDIDIFLTGLNGRRENDSIYRMLSESLFHRSSTAYYKHLCGEYHTSTSFALWVAANCIKRQEYPEILRVSGPSPAKIRNILIYNHHNLVNHSLLLVTDL